MHTGNGRVEQTVSIAQLAWSLPVVVGKAHGHHVGIQLLTYSYTKNTTLVKLG